MTEQQKLVKKLDKIFSTYIRMSAIIKEDYLSCVTCQKIMPWKESDAGHYIGRRHKATRWEEKNVHPQCTYCNRFNEGMKDEYTIFIIKKYGNDTLFELNQKKHTIFKLDNLWLEDKIKHYKDKVKELDGTIT